MLLVGPPAARIRARLRYTSAVESCFDRIRQRMDTLLERLTQQTPQLLLGLLLLNAFLLLLVLALWRKTKSQTAKWRVLLQGSTGDSLEKLLLDHLRDRMELRHQFEAAEARITTLEAKLQTAKRHMGLVRYDAFEEVGGSQSFALALFDDNGNGALVTSLVGRSDCRVFCKPLVGGRSERSLSREEERAMEEAVRDGAKSMLS